MITKYITKPRIQRHLKAFTQIPCFFNIHTGRLCKVANNKIQTPYLNAHLRQETWSVTAALALKLSWSKRQNNIRTWLTLKENNGFSRLARLDCSSTWICSTLIRIRSNCLTFGVLPVLVLTMNASPDSFLCLLIGLVYLMFQLGSLFHRQEKKLISIAALLNSTSQIYGWIGWRWAHPNHWSHQHQPPQPPQPPRAPGTKFPSALAMAKTSLQRFFLSAPSAKFMALLASCVKNGVDPPALLYLAIKLSIYLINQTI